MAVEGMGHYLRSLRGSGIFILSRGSSLHDNTLDWKSGGETMLEPIIIVFLTGAITLSCLILGISIWWEDRRAGGRGHRGR